MADEQNGNGGNGYLSSAWSFGASLVNTVSDTINRYVYCDAQCLNRGTIHRVHPKTDPSAGGNGASPLPYAHPFTHRRSSYVVTRHSSLTHRNNASCPYQRSFMGYEDLNVIDPTTGKPIKASEQADMNDQRAKAFTDYKKYLGKDITSLVILPVWIMQPFTMLQNMAEIMEYTDSLDKAAVTEDPYKRMAHVVAYTMGPFAAVERAWKPFNPILGETFELHKGDKGIKYIAEQVSHHPPIGASHAENDLWEYDLVSAPKTKFLGNSVEVYPIGRTRIKLKGTGDEFTLIPPPTKAHNVIIGKTWIDTCGEYKLINTVTGAKVTIEFTECGWFSAGRYEIRGHVYDPEGTPKLLLEGKWNSHLDCTQCDEEGNALPDAEPERLWTCKPKPENDPYQFTEFAHLLNSIETCDGVDPLPSDSRRRPDRALLELGRSGEAAVAKHSLEEMQRAEKKRREAEDDPWKPRWFNVLPKDAHVHDGEPDNSACPQFQFNGEYLKLTARGDVSSAEDVQGEGFNPWQYEEMHETITIKTADA